MAVLAGLVFGRIERERSLVGIAGVLPFVISSERADPFVVVQLRWKACLMAGGAEFWFAMGVLRHRLRVAIEMSQDFRVGDWSGDWIAALIDRHRGSAEDKASILAPGLDILNRTNATESDKHAVGKDGFGCP